MLDYGGAKDLRRMPRALLVGFLIAPSINRDGG
jgi:hypothetical protein